MKIRFTPEAQSDLARIRRRIAKDNPARALTFIRELRARTLALSHQPRRHPIAFETALGSIHKIVHGRYLIFYRVLLDDVEVLHFRHGAQDAPRFD